MQGFSLALFVVAVALVSVSLAQEEEKKKEVESGGCGFDAINEKKIQADPKANPKKRIGYYGAGYPGYYGGYYRPTSYGYGAYFPGALYGGGWAQPRYWDGEDDQFQDEEDDEEILREILREMVLMRGPRPAPLRPSKKVIKNGL